jgi:Helicase conserved C-terminal domain
MGYRFRAKQMKLEARAFCEKAYRRGGLPPWELKWHELSVAARECFLHVAKGGTTTSAIASRQNGVSAQKFSPQLVSQLADAGFVEVTICQSKAVPERVQIAAAAHDFAARARSLYEFKLLSIPAAIAFARFVKHSFFDAHLAAVLTDVLHGARIGGQFQLFDAIERYVTRHRWPGWVAESLGDPLVAQVLDVVRAAGGSTRVSDLVARIDGSTSDAVRAAVEKLVVRLALVEDLEPATCDLLVGLLPAVQEDTIKANRPRERPPLLVCERPQELGPDRGVIVDDLRAILLEIAGDPPRLRQDHGLFEKESERFEACLEPLPPWLLMALKWHQSGRLSQAITWARGFRMVKSCTEGKRSWLQLTPRGQAWLSASIEEQHATLYDFMRTIGKHEDVDAYPGGFTFFGMNPFDSYRAGEMRFFGEYVAVLKVAQRDTIAYYYRQANPDDELALREHLDRALAVLKPGTFYRLDGVAPHIVFGPANPLNCGLRIDEVDVHFSQRTIPALEEERERAGKLLIEAFVCRRLIPLGCVRTAIDEEGRICIARVPRYDVYFGREADQTSVGPSSQTTGKVVVQPDFTVVVIGLDSGPAAELAPFCERTKRGGGQGATILKVTRESVIKAVSGGLKPDEIVHRLERHASNKVPANVLRQVRDWSSWVRLVTSSTQTLMRCPDIDSADRVMAVLKSKAERVNDTLVAVPQTALNETERTKLRASGIIVQGAYDHIGE